MIDLSNIINFHKNSPDNINEIIKIENSMNAIWPKSYKELLKNTNGFSSGGGLAIYGTKDIVERNETWEVEHYAEGYISIGDDGGGNVFLMQQEEDAKKVFMVDSGDMNPGHANLIASDFTQWINMGCLSEVQPDLMIESPYVCQILLIRVPSGGLKDLVKIKRELGIDISTGELLKGSKNPPFILVRDFPYGKAKKIVGKIGELSNSLKLIPEK